MTTRFPSYVVAEIPEPIRSEIQALRESLSTPTALLPVEITLLGSSGAGPIPAGTSIQLIQDQIDSLFSIVTPWEVSFAEISTFPNTAVAYLAPADRRPFDRLHEVLRNSALPYSVSPFPFNPHCTLGTGRATFQDLSRLTDHPFPTSCFTIDTISVYDLDLESLHCNLIYQKLLQDESGRDRRIEPATPPTTPGRPLRTGRFQYDSSDGKLSRSFWFGLVAAMQPDPDLSLSSGTPGSC